MRQVIPFPRIYRPSAATYDPIPQVLHLILISAFGSLAILKQPPPQAKGSPFKVQACQVLLMAAAIALSLYSEHVTKEKNNVLHWFVNQHQSGLFLERWSVVEEEDMGDKATNEKITRLMEFMRNRQGVFIDGAINSMCLAYGMRQMYKQQIQNQQHLDGKGSS